MGLYVSTVLSHLQVLVYQIYTQDEVFTVGSPTLTITEVKYKKYSKKKVKAVCASYCTAALRHIVLLPERVSSFISRGAAHTKRRERPLLAKEGTISGIQLAIRNSHKLLGSLTCRKAGTWNRFFYFPSGGRYAEDFYARKNPKASAGFEPANFGARGQKIQYIIQNTCKLEYLCKVEHKIQYHTKEQWEWQDVCLHFGVRWGCENGEGGVQVSDQQSRNMQPHYHIICLILPPLCLTEFHRLLFHKNCGKEHLKFKVTYTGCGRYNSHILKVNKNQTKQGTQKNLYL